MQKPTLTVAAAFALWSAAAHADDFTDTVIERYQDMGFQFIEVKRGPTQLKVEAIMPDGRKVEVIYDRATGEILKQENERVEGDEAGRRGVEVDTRREDFLDDDEDDEDDDDDEEDDDEEDDEADESDEEDDDEGDDEEDDDDNEDDGEDDGEGSDESDDED